MRKRRCWSGSEGNGASGALLVLLIALIAFTPKLAGISTLAENEENPRIIGVVSSGRGPVEGARVLLSGLTGGPSTIREAATGPDGSYEFANLTQGSRYLVDVTFEDVRHSKTFQVLNATQRVDFTFTGIVDVEVTLPDGSAAAGVALRLYNSFGRNEVNATTGPGGVGVFDRLEVDDQYTVYLIHEGVPYWKTTDFNGSASSRVEFQILETTTSDADMKVSLHHVIVSQEGNDLGFWEAADYLNTGESVFNNSWLSGWMQPGAFEISHNSMDCCTQFSEEGPFIFDPMDPLFPGDMYLLEISYKAEAKKPTQIIEKKIVYDTETLYFLVEKTPTFTAESLEGLEFVSEDTYGGFQYSTYKGSDLKAGDVVRLSLKTKVTVFDMISGNPLIWGSLILLIPAGAVVYLAVFRKTEGDTVEKLEKEKRTLFSGLAEAERDFEDGKITQEEFEKLREDYKDRSIRILKEMDKRSPKKGLPVASEGPTDGVSNAAGLISELKALDSVLRELNADYERGAITEASYERISASYQERRSQIEEKLRIARLRDGNEREE